MSPLVKRIGKLTLGIARLRPLGAVVGFLFEHSSSLLPIRYLRKTNDFVAFRHPVPVSVDHILAIPCRRVSSSLTYLSESRSCGEILAFSVEVIRCLPPGPFAISTNVGRRQEVKQVHFHIVPAEAQFVRSNREPRATLQLPGFRLSEIQSAGDLTTIEIWLDQGSNDTDLAAAMARLMQAAAGRLKGFPGATVYFYASSTGRAVSVEPSARIVVENPAGVAILDASFGTG